MVFAIHWHEPAMDLHVFPIPIPPPTSLSIPCLWVFPVHQPWAPVSCRNTILNHSSFNSVHFSCSVVSDSATPRTAAWQASLSITNSRSVLKLMSIESEMPSNHLILCRPLILPPAILPSIRVFSNESVLHIRWSKYWSFSFSISPSNEYSGLISFRMYCLDLLAIQGTLKSLIQHHSSKTSIL